MQFIEDFWPQRAQQILVKLEFGETRQFLKSFVRKCCQLVLTQFQHSKGSDVEECCGRYRSDFVVCEIQFLE